MLDQRCLGIVESRFQVRLAESNEPRICNAIVVPLAAQFSSETPAMDEETCWVEA